MECPYCKSDINEGATKCSVCEELLGRARVMAALRSLLANGLLPILIPLVSLGIAFVGFEDAREAQDAEQKAVREGADALGRQQLAEQAEQVAKDAEIEADAEAAEAALEVAAAEEAEAAAERRSDLAEAEAAEAVLAEKIAFLEQVAAEDAERVAKDAQRAAEAGAAEAELEVVEAEREEAEAEQAEQVAELEEKAALEKVTLVELDKEATADALVKFARSVSNGREVLLALATAELTPALAPVFTASPVEQETLDELGEIESFISDGYDALDTVRSNIFDVAQLQQAPSTLIIAAQLELDSTIAELEQDPSDLIKAAELEQASTEIRELNDPLVPKALGYSLLLTGEYEKSIRQYIEAIRRDPEDEEARKGLVYAEALAQLSVPLQ